jgi:hypothetical protein
MKRTRKSVSVSAPCSVVEKFCFQATVSKPGASLRVEMNRLQPFA